jgi:hypothetical protein
MAAMLDQLTRCQLLSSRFKFRRAQASQILSRRLQPIAGCR